MLSHVTKRVRGRDRTKLPLDALLDLYLSASPVPLVDTFAIVAVEMAMDRSAPEQQAAAVSLVQPTHSLFDAIYDCTACIECVHAAALATQMC